MQSLSCQEPQEPRAVMDAWGGARLCLGGPLKHPEQQPAWREPPTQEKGGVPCTASPVERRGRCSLCWLDRTISSQRWGSKALGVPEAELSPHSPLQGCGRKQPVRITTCRVDRISIHPLVGGEQPTSRSPGNGGGPAWVRPTERGQNDATRLGPGNRSFADGVSASSPWVISSPAPGLAM